MRFKPLVIVAVVVSLAVIGVAIYLRNGALGMLGVVALLGSGVLQKYG